MKRRVLLVVVLSIIVCGGAAAITPPIYEKLTPYVPLEKQPTYYYIVRLWALDHNPIWDDHAPVVWHELSDAEIASEDEDRFQTVSVLKYDPPNPFGQVVWGVYHQQLDFVLWMARFKPTPKSQYILAQVAETGKDEYDPLLTPAQNNEAGNIEWFRLKDIWYPRTWTKQPHVTRQAWLELWGPFDEDALLDRVYHFSTKWVYYKGKRYLGYVYTIVGPSEDGPQAVTTERFTFVHEVGMVERYLDIKLSARPNTMLFKHIATLNEAIIPK